MTANSARFFHGGKVTVWQGDSRDVLSGYDADSFDSVVTDPPYALVSIVKRFGKDGAAACIVPEGGTGAYARASAGFMGKQWDTGETAFAPEFWTAVLRILKPGGHILAFSGTRTYHRLACAIEDAGFEIRDMVSWIYGSGFPKSHDVSKGIDKAAGATPRVIAEGRPVARMIPGADQNANGWEKTNGRVYVPQETEAATEAAATWEGWGTALKPASEPIVLARKPLIGTVAANVLKHGTGAINVDGCRVGLREERELNRNGYGGSEPQGTVIDGGVGRWPANVIHDGSEEVTAGFPDVHGAGAAGYDKARESYNASSYEATNGSMFRIGDSGSAARFFYTAKADSDDRIGSKHPTVKPVDLMRYLCRLVTPPGGMILDPFAGTGTTGEAAFYEGFRATLIEREAEYMADIERRMALCLAGPEEKARAIIKAKGLTESPGPLFDQDEAPAVQAALI